MDPKTASQLTALNHEFYQTFAPNFSATRMRLQPGVKRILEGIPSGANILDLGCGNGELARVLARQNHWGRYLGLDFSPDLLVIARKGLQDQPNYTFVQGDLSAVDWDLQVSGGMHLNTGEDGFDIILAFATCHHLPGRDLRIKTCQKVNTLLRTGGRFIHSNWQFLNSARLRQRIQPWAEVGLALADVDAGDYLLDWRQGGRGLRYVHHFDQEELISLAEITAFEVVDWFFSDGEGGRLGLYHVWQKA